MTTAPVRLLVDQRSSIARFLKREGERAGELQVSGCFRVVHVQVSRFGEIWAFMDQLCEHTITCTCTCTTIPHATMAKLTEHTPPGWKMATVQVQIQVQVLEHTNDVLKVYLHKYV